MSVALEHENMILFRADKVISNKKLENALFDII